MISILFTYLYRNFPTRFLRLHSHACCSASCASCSCSYNTSLVSLYRHASSPVPLVLLLTPASSVSCPGPFSHTVWPVYATPCTDFVPTIYPVSDLASPNFRAPAFSGPPHLARGRRSFFCFRILYLGRSPTRPVHLYPRRP